MLMHIARSVDEALTKKWAAMQAEGVDEFGGVEEHMGLQILFLDGEEAFISWTATDSLYGARYLAILLQTLKPGDNLITPPQIPRS
jgi:hypothetical protein